VTLESIKLNKPTTLAVALSEGDALQLLEEAKEHESEEQTNERAISVIESSMLAMSFTHIILLC